MVDDARPTTWAEFIGQKPLKDRLHVHIKAAVQHGRTLDHVLLTGPPGFGKTSLAQIIANEMNDNFYSLTMPIAERAFLRYMYTEVTTGVLLLDELHRCTAKQQENLLPFLEHGVYKDDRGRNHEFHAVTLIGATTERAKLIAPLIDRFPIKPDYIEYSDKELANIALGMAKKLGVTLAKPDAEMIGQAAGGIPRNVRSFVLAARDLETKLGYPATGQDILDFIGVDHDGLSRSHYQYLETLRLLGGRAGLKPLKDFMQISETEIRELERLLVRKRLLTYTEQGRELTQLGMKRKTP